MDFSNRANVLTLSSVVEVSFYFEENITQNATQTAQAPKFEK